MPLPPKRSSNKSKSNLPANQKATVDGAVRKARCEKSAEHSRLAYYKSLKAEVDSRTQKCDPSARTVEEPKRSNPQEPNIVDLLKYFNCDRSNGSLVKRDSLISKSRRSLRSETAVSSSHWFSMGDGESSIGLKLLPKSRNVCELRKTKTTALSNTTIVDRAKKPSTKPACIEPEIVPSISTNSQQTETKSSDYCNWLTNVNISEPNSLSSISSTSTPTRVILDASSNSSYTRPTSDAKKASPKAGARVSCGVSFRAKEIAPKVGVCKPTLHQISRMTPARQRFFLTQDPRKTRCLVNPEHLYQKKLTTAQEWRDASEAARRGDNLCVDNASTASAQSFVCKEINLYNPFNLDFQGLDYRDTYEKDEQDYLNVLQYRRIGSHMERKRTKKQTATNVEEEVYKELISLPPHFDTRDRSEKPPVETPKKPNKDCELYRSTDKPYNIELLRREQQQRYDRYKDLYLRKREREKSRAAKKAEDDRNHEFIARTDLASRLFKKTLDQMEGTAAIRHKVPSLKKTDKLRVHPHTMNEVRQYKYQMEGEKRIKHDQAVVRKEFFEKRVRKQKDYPELHVQLGANSRRAAQMILRKQQPRKGTDDESETQTEESSNDEDNLQVGLVAKGDKSIKLRGFQFKLGDHIRGKYHQRELTDERHRQRGCMTREDYLKGIVQYGQTVPPDITIGYGQGGDPNDPKLILYRHGRGPVKIQVRESPVSAFIRQRLGLQYERVRRKPFKISRPHIRYTIKKFNLVRFLYKDIDRQLEAIRLENLQLERKYAEHILTAEEHLARSEKAKKSQVLAAKHKRLAVMGIPCKQEKKMPIITPCDQESETASDSDFVPSDEPEIISHLSQCLIRPRPAAKHLSERIIGNMPAPKAREATLRRHPRKPRDYSKLRAPSTVFDEIVKTSGVPYMHKLLPEIMRYANVREMERSTYTGILEARHHHDHREPSQKQNIDVHYQPRVMEAQATEDPNAKTRASKDLRREIFTKAMPPCKAYVDADLTLPRCDTEQILAEHRLKKSTARRDPNEQLIADFCRPTDAVYHSRPAEELAELSFRGHTKYVKFLKEVRQLLADSSDGAHYESDEADGAQRLVIDREAYTRELEEDLKSIESCLTSLSSSDCTHLSNDSGSFLAIEQGTRKVPLDYIRKSVIPFEEKFHSTIVAEPFDHDAEETNPFRTFPYCGQAKELKDLYKASDRFYTNSTRGKVNLRMRLEVPPINVKKQPFGRGLKNYPAAVATDLDPNYMLDLYRRTPVVRFNFKSSQGLLKEALRYKFQSYLIEEQVVRNTIYVRRNEHHYRTMLKTERLYERLFNKWEKSLFKDSITTVYRVKDYYQATALLRDKCRELDRQVLLVNMDIVFTESMWKKFLMLQNFHYTLGPQDWRHKHDWMHRIIGRNGRVEMEPIDVSIANRPHMNIRTSGKDEAYVIKEWFESEYWPNRQPLLLPHKTATSFLDRIEEMKSKTFVQLLEMHYTLTAYTEIKSFLDVFEESCAKEVRDKRRFVQTRCEKKYYVENRLENLQWRTKKFMGKPIKRFFSEETYNCERALITGVFSHIMSAGRGDVFGTSGEEVESEIRGLDLKLEPDEMVAKIFHMVMAIFAEFESCDVEKMRALEAELRRERALRRKISRSAYLVERRVLQQMRIVKHNMEPPFVKPKREGKLPHIYFNKRLPRIPQPEIQISEYTKNYFRAFSEDGARMDLSQLRLSQKQLEEADIPFYFDHFLKVNGYTPDYSFQTKVEKRDGPEIDRLKVKAVIPEVMEKMNKWESLRKKTMEDNIAKSQQMYENVSY